LFDHLKNYIIIFHSNKTAASAESLLIQVTLSAELKLWGNAALFDLVKTIIAKMHLSVMKDMI